MLAESIAVECAVEGVLLDATDEAAFGRVQDPLLEFGTESDEGVDGNS